MDSPKLNFFAAMSREELYGPFSFVESAVTGIIYLGVPRESFMPQQQEDLTCQQDGAPPHYQSERLSNRLFERGGPIEWLLRSPDLTAMDYLLWGF
jgi:hypothetical protein